VGRSDPLVPALLVLGVADLGCLFFFFFFFFFFPLYPANCFLWHSFPSPSIRLALSLPSCISSAHPSSSSYHHHPSQSWLSPVSTTTISSLICEFHRRIESNITLITHSYDGDDNADSAPAPAKAEPDPQDIADAAAEALNQGDSYGAAADSEVKQESDYNPTQPQHQQHTDSGMGGMQNEFRDTPADEKPIGIKEDG
jgi:hypothetical protein